MWGTGSALLSRLVQPVRRHVRCIRLQDQRLQRELRSQTTKLQRPLVSDRTAEAQPETKPGERLRLLQAAIKSMRNARTTNVSQPLEQLICRAAYMQDYR